MRPYLGVLPLVFRALDETSQPCEKNGLACNARSHYQPEKSLLGTQNLDRRSRVFRQVRERTRLRDKPCSDDLSNERRQVGRHSVHLGSQVAVELLTIVGERNNTVRKALNVGHVDFREILSHGAFGSFQDLLGFCGVRDDLFDFLEALFGQGRLVLHRSGELGVHVVVVDDLDQLGEVPAVPFAEEIERISDLDRNQQDLSSSTNRTRIEKVLISLSSWSNREMAWIIMLSALLTLNLTLARE